MPVINDDLWKNPGVPGMIVVSSHAAVDEDGRLFLGYGSAKEAIRRIPGIEEQCGKHVLAKAKDGVYGFLPVRPPRPEARIVGFGIFQTRFRWDEGADPGLIRYSMDRLRDYTSTQPALKIRMNLPGVEDGNLPVDDVVPLLLPLPASVTVCHHGQIKRSPPISFPGFKTLYLEVEAMLHSNHFDAAVEYLVRNGYDLQSALEQVQAVERMRRERKESETASVNLWRSGY